MKCFECSRIIMTKAKQKTLPFLGISVQRYKINICSKYINATQTLTQNFWNWKASYISSKLFLKENRKIVRYKNILLGLQVIGTLYGIYGFFYLYILQQHICPCFFLKKITLFASPFAHSPPEKHI